MTDLQEKQTETARPLAPRLGVVGSARWFWRQLTSMRTALFLLLLLAIAAVPGSIWPQRGVDAARVADYLDRHQTLGPWLDRFGFFDVYSSPWFAAIYLLLVVSLLGCLLPRMRQQWQAARAEPPAAPRRLSRLPAYASEDVDATPEEVLNAARTVLRRKRFRLRDGDGWLSAEVGLGREIGNLVFHVGLVVIIVALAAGHLFGWRGDVIVPEGESFASTAGRYDTLDPGPWVDVNELPPWTLRVNSLNVSFEDRVDQSSSQFGQPRDFAAEVTTQALRGEPRRERLAVNHPVSSEGASVYLLGNGYAPKVTVRDASGRILYQQATPFLPQDNVYKSVGAIKVTGASPQQLGFFGFFIPTLAFDDKQGPVSTYPGLRQPALVLGLYAGDLFPQGRPQSVYTLDTRAMQQVRQPDGEPLRLIVQPGQTVQLPNGLGSISMDRDIPRWAGLSVRSDPGKMPALIAALVGLAGLIVSLVLRRRRVFVRVTPPNREQSEPGSADQEDGRAQRAPSPSEGMRGAEPPAGGAEPPAGSRTLVEVGGLAKNQDPRLESAVEHLLADIVHTSRTGTRS